MTAYSDLEMNQTDIYRQAIQRSFAALYNVPVDAVHVYRNAERTTERCAGKTFTSHTDSEDERFVSEDDDPVTITLSDERPS